MNHTGKTPAEIFAAKALASQMRRELTGNILPFWMNKMSCPSGGLYGRIDGQGNLKAETPVGGIMTARVLWTFASAYRVLSGSATTTTSDLECYLTMAMRAKRLLLDSFVDSDFGGTYWSLTPDFTPLDTKKQIYSIAFGVYALAELYRACGDEEALECAIKLFHSIEDHSYDSNEGGYFEAFTRTWEPIDDMRLSDKDANESKTMNTHLHVLEAYTCLYRVWKDELLAVRLRGLIEVFERHIVGSDGHLKLFFDNSWNCSYDIVSYGHDIEASWLLHEAALVLGEKDTLERIEALVTTILKAASEGFSPAEGLIYEKSDEGVDRDRHWWVQAEAVVGFYNLWDHFGKQEGLENSLLSWEFIKTYLIDRENGEWYWSVRADGSINRDDDKAGFWKCPYHNGRMCMEIIERTR